MKIRMTVGSMTKRLILLVTATTILNACSWLSFEVPIIGIGGDPVPEPVATLADLQPAVLPNMSETLPSVDLDTLVATYTDVLAVSDDPDIRQRVMHRLAGLEMKRGEQKLYEQQAGSGQFSLAISAYTSLLENDPQNTANDKLLYQLSKAYDLSGQVDDSMRVLTQLVNSYPQSDHYVEAQFRRAEMFFAMPDYLMAEKTYADVVAQGEDSSHYQNALYMYGWSLFKRERYRASLKPFSLVLDLNVPEDNKLDGLKRGQRELTVDALKIMSIAFSYLDGAQTIAEVFDSLGERQYMPLLYDHLGMLYLKQERYRDSAGAYRAYIDRYPQSDQSPVFYASLIDAFIEGGFPDDVLLEKQNYVADYGIHSNYWQGKSEPSRDYIRPFLEKYIPELARHFHAKAQAGRALLAKVNSSKTIAKKSTADKTLLSTGNKKVDVKKVEQLAVEDFLQAGHYYQEFIDTFPDDSEIPEMYFLLAESRFDAGVYADSIEAYEVVAYKYPEHKRGANAGYAAIVAYGLILDSVKPVETPEANNNDLSEYETWMRLKIASQLRFADTFVDDLRSNQVLAKSAEELMALNEYQQAVNAAELLTRRNPPADVSLQKTAWLVIGHSQFELQGYAEAEIAYHNTLKLMPENDSGKYAIVERLAASVYKQAEQAMQDKNNLLAVEQYLRVAEVAPGSAISVTAQFDAANTLLDIENYSRAITVLNNFRRDYPVNSLAADIPAKLVVAYQNTEQWALAAEELTGIYNGSSDENVKRETLYQAAELFEKAGDKETALLRYRSYANAFPEPFGIAMEAQFKLSDLYQQTGQPGKQRFWLKKMIAADKAAGALGTDRSRYLAAMSSAVLAEDEFKKFQKISLTLPLKSSLKKKKSALNKTLKAYQAVADYGVSEFSTLATFKIADIYSQLSRDLLDSERPENLDELALEQYEILLEEQAFPFEEQAIDIHETNSKRSRDGVYDIWVKRSFKSLAALLPARYGKEEKQQEYLNEIF